MLYAQVCVNTPLGRRIGPSLGADVQPGWRDRVFTYAVPAALEERLQPGHLVWVQFRSRRLQAVVLSLTSQSPEFDTREIISTVWAQPVLTPAQLDLAHWVSEYYLVPLIDALRMMLPVRITQRGRTVYVSAGDPHPDGLSVRQELLLRRLDEGEATWAEIKEELPKLTQAADLEPLLEMGLVTREVAFSSPPPRPKVERVVELRAGASGAGALRGLGHRSPQADALEWLAQQEDPLPSQRELCAAVKCTPGTLRTLEAAGHVKLVPGEVLRRTVPESALPGALAGLAEEPALAAALAAAPEAPAEVAEWRVRNNVPRRVLAALAKRDLVEVVTDEPAVMLLAPRAELPALLRQLRATDRHHRVIEALQAAGGKAKAARLYEDTGADLALLRTLEAAGLVELGEQVVWRDPLAGIEFTPDSAPPLTPDQQRAWQALAETISCSADRLPEQRGCGYLLYGVTGSGKTEVYLRAIAEVLERRQQAVVLVPDIALTPQTSRRFAARFPGQVTLWHSELSDGERFDVWRRVRKGHPAAQVVVGSRSSLFLPFPDLGIIIVDEEHEPTYKQEATPRYHARQVALQLGQVTGAPVVLGSATPALESFYAARSSALRLLALPKRVAGHRVRLESDEEPEGSLDLPAVHVVDMRQELRVGNRGVFSRRLERSMRRVLAAGQQAILYLNRRGTASFVLCRDCGHVENCVRCGIPLTYHGAGEMLLCHHCNRRYSVPTLCPVCASTRIRYFGSGTQSIEEATALLFPGARCLRWDRDVTGPRGSHDAILTQFMRHEADVLIGTQMIAKGLDLPLVTLVGVMAADTGLFLPDFRAAERTFQLLTQVSGRAGRSDLGGEVVVQTYHPDHYALQAASRHDYEAFYRQELSFRREQSYPPYARLARAVFYNSRDDRAREAAEAMAGELRVEAAHLGLPDITVLGPAPCFFRQQRGLYRWQVIVRGPDPTALLRDRAIPPGCRLDVDPTELL